MLLAKPKLIMFDLDGTLVDSVPDLALSIDLMLDDLGLPGRGEKYIRHWVGNGAERLIKRALTGDMDAEPDPELLQRAMVLFREHYRANTCVRSRFYPGVLDALEYLKAGAMKLACITNKPRQFTDLLLRGLGIYHDFDIVVAGDSLPTMKPDPLPLLHAAEYCNVSPVDCLMVGDSITDINAARAAGIRVLCVSYGYNRGRNIREAGADLVLDSLSDLPQLL